LFLSCHSCSFWHHFLRSFSALLFILLLVGLLGIILHATFAHSCCTFSCLKLLFFLFNVVAYSLAWSYCSSYSMLLDILLLEVIVLHIRCYFMFLSHLFVWGFGSFICSMLLLIFFLVSVTCFLILHYC
jgi:hypothetical protein